MARGGGGGAYLQPLQNLGQEPVDVQLRNLEGLVGVRAQPLAGALHHCQEGVQVKGHQAAVALAAGGGAHPCSGHWVSQRDDTCFHLQILVPALLEQARVDCGGCHWAGAWLRGVGGLGGRGVKVTLTTGKVSPLHIGTSSQ